MTLLSLERLRPGMEGRNGEYSLGDPGMLEDSSVATQVTGWEFLMGSYSEILPFLYQNPTLPSAICYGFKFPALTLMYSV